MSGMKTAALGVTLGLALMGAAAPQGPAGDWRSTPAVTSRPLEIGMRVRPAPGGYAATYEGISQGFGNVPMTPVRQGPGPAFATRSPVGWFSARWDAKAAAWTGAWRARGQVYPMTFRRGLIPPPPRAPSPPRSPRWRCGPPARPAAAIAWLLVLRRRRRRRIAAAAAA